MSRDIVRTWEIELSQGFETTWVSLGDSRMTARGRAFGRDPWPYWLTYALETGDDYVTRRLVVEVESAPSTNRLDLARADDGEWTANGERVDHVAGALDCDLGKSPLTNTMPILRHRLHEQEARHDFVMAWVAVPELTVHRSEQTYEHIRRTAQGSIVRYIGGHRSFVGDLEVDPDGLLVNYPQLGHRIG
jgi:hypothetical protein